MRHLDRLVPSLAAAALLVAAPANAAAPAKPGCTANTKACMESVARMYIDALVAHDGKGLPLAPGIRRTENALTNARGPHEVVESFVRTTMVETTGPIRFVTDVERRQVIAFFTLNIDLKEGGGDTSTKAGNTEYKVAVSKPAGTYTVHEAERFRIVDGRIHEIEIIAHVEDGKGLGSGWPVERVSVVKK